MNKETRTKLLTAISYPNSGLSINIFRTNSPIHTINGGAKVIIVLHHQNVFKNNFLITLSAPANQAFKLLTIVQKLNRSKKNKKYTFDPITS